MKKIERIGVLTGGGDCPGLNPAIKAITTMALDHGVSVVGFKEGWRGLTRRGADYQIEMSTKLVRDIDRTGGTVLLSSRTNPFKLEGGIDAVQKTWKDCDLDALIAIGGEDTLGVASRLFKDHGMPIVGVPKTIDRDLSGTDYTLGFESALEVITESVDRIRTTAESHSRVFVVEVMGRHAGHLALLGGISAGADVILIPEQPFELDRIMEILLNRQKLSERYSIVIAAEGAVPKDGSQFLQTGETDAFGHVRLGGIGEALSNLIEKQTGLSSRSVNLSHLQRGGAPVAYDRRMGFYFGTASVQAVLDEKFGMMASYKHGKIGLVTLEEAVGRLRVVDLANDYDTKRYRAKSLGSSKKSE